MPTKVSRVAIQLARELFPDFDVGGAFISECAAIIDRALEPERKAVRELEEAAKAQATGAETTRRILQDRFRRDSPDHDVDRWCHWGSLDTQATHQALTKLRTVQGEE